MRKTFAAICLCVVAAVALPSSAGTEVVIGGLGVTASGQCLVLDGFSSGTTGDSSWASGYWERITTPSPVCSDTEPHFDPVINCVQAFAIDPNSPAGGVVVYIASTNRSQSSYLFKLVDRPTGADELGVLVAEPTTGPCGAGAVVSAPLAGGNFTIATA